MLTYLYGKLCLISLLYGNTGTMDREGSQGILPEELFPYNTYYDKEEFGEIE